MKFARVYGIIPVPIFYVDFIEVRKLRDGNEGEVIGRSHWLWIEIVESQKENRGLLAHELKHCEQGWTLPFGLHGLVRGLILRYRAWCEAQAYAAQLLAYGLADQYYNERLDAARAMILKEAT